MEEGEGEESSRGAGGGGRGRVWIRRLRLDYRILLKVERIGLGKAYGVGVNNEVNVWVDGSLAFAICGEKRV